MKKRAVVAMGGGPTRVINHTLYGIIAEAGKLGIEVLAARHGIDGILGRNFIDVNARTPLIVQSRDWPGACIGSTRHKPNAEDCENVLKILTEKEAHFFFYIGGNDTSGASGIINAGAKRLGYELRTFHVPKTIDNDLVENDHCPGYGSAARYVAHAVMGDDLDVRSIPGIKIDVIMGRDAGWLTAASALCRTADEEGPHLVFLPERPKGMAELMDAILSVYGKYGRAVVAVAEGLKGTDNEPFLNSPAVREEIETSAYKPLAGVLDAMEAAENATGGGKRDQFNHIQLSGTGALADFLAACVKVAGKINNAKVGRVRADTLGYPQRAYAGDVSPVDADEAEMIGREAVKIAMSGDVDGSITLRADRKGGYKAYAKLVKLERVADKVRLVPASFINKSGIHVAKAFLDYARPLVGKLARG